MYVCIYVRMYVCMYVCMYVWSVDDVANLMPLFCFMFIQGEQLLDASKGGDMASVRLLLEEDPNLVRYKGLVSTTCYTIVNALLHYLFTCIHLLLLPHPHNMHPYIHTLYLSSPPAQLLRHIITEPCILS